MAESFRVCARGFITPSTHTAPCGLGNDPRSQPVSLHCLFHVAQACLPTVPAINSWLMQPQPFQIVGRAGPREGQYILKAQGPIGMSSRATFLDAVKSAQGNALIIDLSEVPHIDSAAVGALVHAYVSCQKAGRKLGLVGLTHRVSNVMKISAVDALFTTYPTVSEAEEALAQATRQGQP